MSVTPIDPPPPEGPKDVSLAPIAEQAAPPPKATAAEDVNLVSSLTDEEQKIIVDTCIRDFDADMDSRAPRMRRLSEFQGLYASVMKAKAFPFKNAANVNLPILTYPLLQIQGRCYDMVWPANGKILYSSPTNLTDVARANATEIFGNAYIRHKMPEMPQGIDDTLHQVCCYGSGFRRTYWNGYEKRACSDWIPIEDFVVAYGERSQDPSMRDVPRYTLVQRLTYYDIESYGDGGIFANVDKVKPTRPDEDRTETPLRRQLERIDGSSPAGGETTDEDKPRCVLEQHRKWRMPNRPDINPAFDGKPHAVIVTVDDESKQLLRFVVREEPDPDDHVRFQRETAAYEAHLNRLESYAREAQAYQTVSEAMAAQGLQVDPAVQPPPMMPPPPPGLEIDAETQMPIEPAKQRVREICFFTHYRAFPSEGFYGLGFGDFIAGLNKAVNTLVNQQIDGGTLRNAMPLFMSAQMKGARGALNVQPGEIIEIDAPAGALKDGMYSPQFPPPDPTNMRIVQICMEAADKLVASSDMMSGQTSGANRTAKETEILAEQMMMQITVLARRIKEAFKHELDKIWRIWGVFLPDEEIVDLIGPEGDPMSLKIGRSMFIPNAHVIPAADPRTKSQRLGETMQVFQAVSTNPYLMSQPPPVRDALMRAVTEDVLRAHGADKLVKLLPPMPPPGPPPPPPPAPYWEEDAGFFRGQDHPVHPSDNDQEHIAGHQRTIAGPAGQKLDKQGRDMAERHIRFHIAQDIQKTGQQQQQQAQLFNQLLVQQGGPAPMQGAPQ